LRDVLNEVVDGGAAFGIVECGDVAGGFVKQDVELLLFGEGFVVEENAVAVEVDPHVGVFYDAAVDFDAACVDPAAGLGSGAHAGF